MKQAELKKIMQAKEAALQESENDYALKYNAQIYAREQAERDRKERLNKVCNSCP